MTLTSFALSSLLRPAFLALASAPAQGQSLAYDVQLAPGERLLEYRWDGGARVPFDAADPSVRVEHGERGLGARTRLYLPANGLAECAATGATMLEQGGVAPSGLGRYGRALAFGPSSHVTFSLPPVAPGGEGWTLSFWARPGAAAFGTTLALLPGAVEVRLRADGRVEAQLLPAGERLTSARTLAAGVPAFVAVAYDPRFLRQARLFVDGELVALRPPAPAPAREPTHVWLGDVARNGRGPELALDELCLEPFALSTAEIRRIWQPPLAAGTHSLELRTTLGLREAQPALAIAADLDLDTAAELQQGALRGVVLAGGELRWAPGRWRDLAPRRAPPPRTTQPLVALGGGRLLTFGGETRDTHLGQMVNTGDTWIFDGAAGTWEEVAAQGGPPPRCHVPMAYSPDHDLALLVGGWKNDVTPGATFADTWVLRVAARRWEQRFPGGDAMGPGSDHGLVYLPSRGQFLLLQGQANALYDPLADRWRRLPVARVVDESGAPASYRVGASTMCALDPASGEVVLFGGSSGPSQSVFSDVTALYDVATNTYTVLAPPVRPSGRVRSAFAYDPRRGHFVLFGGVRDQYSQRHDDLWVFTPATREWHELACSGRPSPRGGYYGMAYDEVGDRFLLYGGRNAVDRWLDDTLSLELDALRPGTAVFTFDRGAGPAPRNAWLADCTTPGRSSVSFLFRGSHTGAQWSGWSPSTAGFADRRFLQAVAFLKPGARGEVPSIRRVALQ